LSRVPRPVSSSSRSYYAVSDSRTYRPTHRTRRQVGLAYVGLIVLVLLTTVPMKVGVGDTWMQIKTGEYIWYHGIPQRDPFSYTAHAGGEPYTEHEWLWCLLVYGLYTWSGALGLLALKLALISGTYALVVGTAPQSAARHDAVTMQLLAERNPYADDISHPPPRRAAPRRSDDGRHDVLCRAERQWQLQDDPGLAWELRRLDRVS